MIRPINKDRFFLAQKSVPATEADLGTAQDLLDTLRAHRETCVGMAANMIGVARRIIVFADGDEYRLMLNPELVQKSGPFEAEEGCLSLTGTRKTTRYQRIRVRYQNERMQYRQKNYSGWTAQIIQHEIDHLNGIVI